MKFLITGIPGTGKTTIGNWLEDKHSFKHIDFEAENWKIRNEFQKDKEKFLQNLKSDNIL